ncbi:hypothetical protein B0H14DRAFT_2860685 [Mycena olivaceomarginata]|nr:hypothetical protein B0H14DRAFT_2860685 [Mycena olivaceomarginata]
MSSASAEIFEIYALSWPKLIPKLMLVAKCVKEWVEPLLYRIISIDVFPIAGLPWVAVDIMSALSIEASTFFHGAVRHLMLYHSDVYEMILSPCSGVEDLCLPKLSVVEDAWIPLIERLPLRRLCAYYNLFAVLPLTNSAWFMSTNRMSFAKRVTTSATSQSAGEFRNKITTDMAGGNSSISCTCGRMCGHPTTNA